MLKSVVVTIVAENRDKGKVFVVNEMPANPFEQWALKALTAMGRAGLEISEDTWSMGAMSLGIMGFKSLIKMNYEDAQELMDLMFSYVRIQPDPNNPNIQRPLVDSDIEEITTRLKLRAAWWEQQTGFQLAGSPSPSTPGT